MQMLKPRLKTLDPWAARGLKMVDELKKPWLKLEDIKTSRWVKAKNGRLLPLNNAAWRKLRASVLMEQPLCPECQARDVLEPATQVHHKDDNASNNTRSNLVGLCASCHSRHTAADMGGNVRMGCDKDGKPLDHRHHWNAPAMPLLASLEGGVLKRSPATERHEPTVLPCFNANRESVA